jgi:hypothetical protein
MSRQTSPGQTDMYVLGKGPLHPSIPPPNLPKCAVRTFLLVSSLPRSPLTHRREGYTVPHPERAPSTAPSILGTLSQLRASPAHLRGPIFPVEGIPASRAALLASEAEGGFLPNREAVGRSGPELEAGPGLGGGARCELDSQNRGAEPTALTPLRLPRSFTQCSSRSWS